MVKGNCASLASKLLIRCWLCAPNTQLCGHSTHSPNSLMTSNLPPRFTQSWVLALTLLSVPHICSSKNSRPNPICLPYLSAQGFTWFGRETSPSRVCPMARGPCWVLYFLKFPFSVFPLLSPSVPPQYVGLGEDYCSAFLFSYFSRYIQLYPFPCEGIFLNNTDPVFWQFIFYSLFFSTVTLYISLSHV